MKRIQSVDTFRVIAVIMIIALHTNPFRSMPPSGHAVAYNYVSIGINNLAKFAVPFFFITSGYFWGIKIRNGGDPITTSVTMIKRLGIVFLFWCFVYIIPYEKADFYSSILKIFTQSDFHNGILEISKFTTKKAEGLLQLPPIILIMQGTKVHLWFLISLISSIGISSIFIHFKTERSLVSLALALYIFGILAKAYSKTPMGISFFEFDTRNGPFFSSLFFVSGYYMSGLEPNHRWLRHGLFIFATGCAIQCIEIYFLHKIYGTDPRQDYVFGTFFMGLGIATSALSNHPSLQIEFLGKTGQLTLGIYAIHFIFIDLFSKVAHSPAWEIGYVIVVFTLSLLFAYILSNFRITKKFVG